MDEYTPPNYHYPWAEEIPYGLPLLWKFLIWPEVDCQNAPSPEELVGTHDYDSFDSVLEWIVRSLSDTLELEDFGAEYVYRQISGGELDWKDPSKLLEQMLLEKGINWSFEPTGLYVGGHLKKTLPLFEVGFTGAVFSAPARTRQRVEYSFVDQPKGQNVSLAGRKPRPSKQITVPSHPVDRPRVREHFVAYPKDPGKHFVAYPTDPGKHFVNYSGEIAKSIPPHQLDSDLLKIRPSTVRIRPEILRQIENVGIPSSGMEQLSVSHGAQSHSNPRNVDQSDIYMPGKPTKEQEEQEAEVQVVQLEPPPVRQKYRRKRMFTGDSPPSSE